MYTIKKSKTQWIIKFKKPVLNRLLNAHAWVYPVFWGYIEKRITFLTLSDRPHRILLDFAQSEEITEKFPLIPFGFSHTQSKVADFFVRGLNSTMCGGLEEALEAIEDFAAKYLSK